MEKKTAKKEYSGHHAIFFTREKKRDTHPKLGPEER